MVHAIGQGDPGYKTTYHAWRTQKTARTAQTQHHPQCQKETQVYAPGEQRRVGARVAIFRGRCPETLGHPVLSCQAQNQTESQRGGQKESLKSGQESIGVEIVENPVMGRTQRRRAAPRSRPRRRRRRSQRGGKLFDVQNLLNKTGIEFHWPGYQYMGPGTHLKKRLARGDPGINRLDRIAKAHDIDYDKAKNLQDKWVADRKMIAKTDQLPGRKSLTERIVKNIMKAKLRLGM